MKLFLVFLTLGLLVGPRQTAPLTPSSSSSLLPSLSPEEGAGTITTMMMTKTSSSARPELIWDLKTFQLRECGQKLMDRVMRLCRSFYFATDQIEKVSCIHDDKTDDAIIALYCPIGKYPPYID